MFKWCHLYPLKPLQCVFFFFPLLSLPPFTPFSIYILLQKPPTCAPACSSLPYLAPLQPSCLSEGPFKAQLWLCQLSSLETPIRPALPGSSPEVWRGLLTQVGQALPPSLPGPLPAIHPPAHAWASVTQTMNTSPNSLCSFLPSCLCTYCSLCLACHFLWCA